MKLLVYPYLIFAGMVAALVLVPIFKYLSVRWGVMDVPRPGRIHSRSTPLLGGPAIFLGMMLVVGGHFALGQILARGSLLSGWLSPQIIAQMRYSLGGMSRLAAIFLGALVVLGIGVADDVRSLPIWVRLGAEFAAAAVVVALGVKPELYILPHWLVYVVAVVWIVGITNSFNLIDSMDGLAAGVAAVAAALLGFWAALSGQPMVAMLLACLVGVLVGFLFFNWSPAGIFLGSSGSMLLGYFLAVAVLVSTFMTGGHSGLLPVVMPLIILGVPLYDTASVVAIRLYRRRSPFSPDLNHLAHRRHRLGLSRRQTVLFIYLMTLAVGLGAVLLAESEAVSWKLKALVVLAQVLAVFGVVIVLEMVSFGKRSVRLATPVRARLDLELEGAPPSPSPARLVGKVTRLGLARAELDVEDLDADLAGRMLAQRAAGEFAVLFVEPFKEVRAPVTVRGLKRTWPGGWRVSLVFGELSGEARQNLEFALTHYRAMGEG